MRLTVLASGSSGNAVVVQGGGTSILIDCGISCRQISKRMCGAGLDPRTLEAVLLTHEHADHVQGLKVFSRRYSTPLVATRGTAEALADLGAQPEALLPGREWRCGALKVHPFSVSHDAREPVGLVVEYQGCRVGILTDCGTVTELVVERLVGSQALLVEANHDVDMLRLGPYPWTLKQRIASRIGHLSNEQAQRLLERLAHAQLQTVVGMHLSRQNNTPELVRQELERPLRGSAVRLEVASQEQPLTIDVD